MGGLVEAVQEATGESVELVYVDRGYAGEEPAQEAEVRGIQARFRRLAKDYERLPETVTGLHFVVFACLMLNRAVLALGAGP